MEPYSGVGVGKGVQQQLLSSARYEKGIDGLHVCHLRSSRNEQL